LAASIVQLDHLEVWRAQPCHRPLAAETKFPPPCIADKPFAGAVKRSQVGGHGLPTISTAWRAAVLVDERLRARSPQPPSDFGEHWHLVTVVESSATPGCPRASRTPWTAHTGFDANALVLKPILGQMLCGVPYFFMWVRGRRPTIHGPETSTSEISATP